MNNMKNWYKSRLVNQLIASIISLIFYRAFGFEIAVIIILGIIEGNQIYKEYKDEDDAK